MAARQTEWRALRALAVAGFALLCGGHSHADVPNTFIDPSDGQFDMSRYLLENKGVLPVPVIITEPALGYGGGLFGLFFDQPLGEALKTSLGETGKAIPPNITGLGGFKTANGSWGAGAGHHHTWERDTWRYLGGVFGGHLVLDFYGRFGRAYQYELDGSGIFQQLLRRIDGTDFFVGARYAWLSIQPGFDLALPPELGLNDVFDLRIGRLSLVVDHDTRNNIFSPTDGHFVEAEFVSARPWLGGTVSYEQFNIRGFNWTPIGDFVLGLRGDLQTSSGDIPFFARPFVTMRGIPAQRYQGDDALAAEVELQWLATPRWTLLGFGGAGKAWGPRDSFSQAQTASAGGVGIRYLIARVLGLTAGIDVAYSDGDTAFYIQVGSPWR